MRTACLLLCLMAPPLAAAAEVVPVEVRQRLALPADGGGKILALTLDACGGKFDADIVDMLVAHRIPATIFATRKWIRRNPGAVALLNAHADLFEIEDHGANHVPAVVGAGRGVYGIAGVADLRQLRAEVAGGAKAVADATGTAPHWYRGATGEYDPQALHAIEAMGYKIAGFSVNADGGARLDKRRIVARLKKVRSGDIIIAHLNKPDSDTAEGLAEALPWLLGQGFRFVKLDGAAVEPQGRKRP
ncbi:MAG TPA: polysaccharide deacetylase family protein [Burkholderiales bacterium]|nr:polysaccharide deacetylase family protein [Burkholderiales bacterium]